MSIPNFVSMGINVRAKAHTNCRISVTGNNEMIYSDVRKVTSLTASLKAVLHLKTSLSVSDHTDLQPSVLHILTVAEAFTCSPTGIEQRFYQQKPLTRKTLNVPFSRTV